MEKDKFNILAFTDDQIDDELIDALIKAGSHEYIQNSILEVPSEELSDIEFSDELDKRMLKYFDTLEKHKNKSKIKYIYNKSKNIVVRAAAILFVLIVLAVGFVATSEAAQVKLLNMYVEHSDIESVFDFGTSSDGTKLPYSEKQMIDSLEQIFWYIPQGYELVNEIQDVNMKQLYYEDMDNGYLTIMQAIEKGNATINSEAGTNFTIEVNGIDCFISEHEDKVIAVFEINRLYMSIITSLPLEEVIKIIENINY